MIMNCKCKHEGQDKLNGAGKRVFNVNAKGEAICTVCGASKFAGNQSAPKKK